MDKKPRGTQTDTVDALRFLGPRRYAQQTGADPKKLLRKMIIRRPLRGGCELVIGPWWEADKVLKLPVVYRYQALLKRQQKKKESYGDESTGGA